MPDASSTVIDQDWTWRRAERPGLAEVDAATFRALVIASPPVLENIRTPEIGPHRWPSRLVGVSATRSDLVSTEWVGRRDQPATLRDARFTDCVFDPLSIRDATFERCVFDHAAIGQLSGSNRIVDSVLTDCTFHGCRFGDLGVHQATLADCAFTSVRSGVLSFDRCTLRNLTIHGRPSALEFDRCRFVGVDLTEAKPRRLVVTRLRRGSTARLFDRPDHIVVPTDRLPGLLVSAKGLVSASAYAAFGIFIESYGPTRGVARLYRIDASHVDVRPDDVLRPSEGSEADRGALWELVRSVRVTTLES
jgi:hypothetical protein